MSIRPLGCAFTVGIAIVLCLAFGVADGKAPDPPPRLIVNHVDVAMPRVRIAILNLDTLSRRRGFDDLRIRLRLDGHPVESVRVYKAGNDVVEAWLDPDERTFDDLRAILHPPVTGHDSSLVTLEVTAGDTLLSSSSPDATLPFRLFDARKFEDLRVIAVVLGIVAVILLWRAVPSFAKGAPWGRLIGGTFLVWAYGIPATYFILLFLLWFPPRIPLFLVFDFACILAAAGWAVLQIWERESVRKRAERAVKRHQTQLDEASKHVEELYAEIDDSAGKARRAITRVLIETDLAACAEVANELTAIPEEQGMAAFDWGRALFLGWSVLFGASIIAATLRDLAFPDPGRGASFLTAAICAGLIAGEYGRTDRVFRPVRRLRAPDFGHALATALRFERPSKVGDLPIDPAAGRKAGGRG